MTAEIRKKCCDQTDRRMGQGCKQLTLLRRPFYKQELRHGSFVGFLLS